MEACRRWTPFSAHIEIIRWHVTGVDLLLDSAADSREQEIDVKAQGVYRSVHWTAPPYSIYNIGEQPHGQVFPSRLAGGDAPCTTPYSLSDVTPANAIRISRCWHLQREPRDYSSLEEGSITIMATALSFSLLASSIGQFLFRSVNNVCETSSNRHSARWGNLQHQWRTQSRDVSWMRREHPAACTKLQRDAKRRERNKAKQSCKSLNCWWMPFYGSLAWSHSRLASPLCAIYGL